MGQILLDTPHIQAEERAELGVLIVRRTASRPETPAELSEAYGAALLLPRQQYAGWGLLIDTRLAPGRNEPAFEEAMNELRDRAGKMFPRVAVLVASAAGLLHSQRLRGETGSIGLITRDESEALAFAAGDRPANP